MGGCVSVHAKVTSLKKTKGFKPVTETDTDSNRRPKSQTPRNSGPITSRFSGPIASKFSGPITITPKFSGPITPRFSRPITILKDPSGNDIFKRYQLGKELGRGEFGVTYQCLDTVTGETLACKKISKRKLKSEIVVEDVRREVEIMRHLPPHPNIVRYKAVYEDREAVYLVMELCEGGELFDRIIARGHYSEQAAAMVAKTIAEVVQVCHNHGVVHRDLKPENFLFANNTESSPLKAIDFGLSIFFEPGQRFGDIVGSPYYMAPEVLRREYGPECDIWSAGVILYILLCGVPPFWAETEEGIAHAIVRCKVNFEKDPWPKISADAKDLVKGMLDPNPYNRMTVEEVLAHQWIQNLDKVPTCPLGEGVRCKIMQFSLMNKFKKKALRVVAYNLPDEKLNMLENVFHMMDTDKNGNLTFDELKHGLMMIGQTVPDPEVKLLIDAADVEGNGTINCEEFVTMSVHLNRMSNNEQLRQAFQFFDKNESGYIEFEELREALLSDNLGPNSEQVIEEIMFAVDLNKDGHISYEEFETMMTTGMDWRMASRKYSRAKLNALSLRMFKDRSGPLNQSGPLFKSGPLYKSGPLHKSGPLKS